MKNLNLSLKRLLMALIFLSGIVGCYDDEKEKSNSRSSSEKLPLEEERKPSENLKPLDKKLIEKNSFHLVQTSIFADETKTRKEKQALVYLISLLMDNDRHQKMVNLCKDQSPGFDLDACVKKANLELSDLYLFTSKDSYLQHF